MGQITIHLDTESEVKAKNYAKKMNISLDKWIAELIVQKTLSDWPESVKKLGGPGMIFLHLNKYGQIKEKIPGVKFCNVFS